MWYIACLIRGMTIDEAIRQLRFIPKKGATYILETLLEAQEKAVKEHNIEFKSNLWVGKYSTNLLKFVSINSLKPQNSRLINILTTVFCFFS